MFHEASASSCNLSLRVSQIALRGAGITLLGLAPLYDIFGCLGRCVRALTLCSSWVTQFDNKAVMQLLMSFHIYEVNINVNV